MTGQGTVGNRDPQVCRGGRAATDRAASGRTHEQVARQLRERDPNRGGEGAWQLKTEFCQLQRSSAVEKEAVLQQAELSHY